MAQPIDLDRGVTQRINNTLQLTVCMYKDDPGVYYAPNGVEVNEEAAREAGFDVESDKKERARLQKRRKALEEIDRDFGIVAEGEVVENTGDFRVQHLGGGWFNVINTEDEVLNQRKLRKSEALDFLKSLQTQKDTQDGTAT